MDMCRFSGLDDVEYGKVVGALHRILEAASKSTPLDMTERTALTAEQRRNCLSSLWFEHSDARRKSIKTAHVKTCKWFLNKSEYQDWLDIDKIRDHQGCLWIKGKPGAGKSTIMKYAYANAKTTMTNTIISFFFNARGEDLEKSALGMYRSLLFQLLEKIPELQSLLDVLSYEYDSDRWDIETIKEIFGTAVQNLGQRCLTCFIDALDECEEDQVREMVRFFEHLGQIAVSSQIRFRVCFSSRHYPHITIKKGVQLILEEQEGHQQDIANYLQTELKAGKSKQVEQIKDEILERASGVFLWVVLVVNVLNKEYDRGRVHALRKRLNEIPNGLHDLFKDILLRDCQNLEELILCLQWILYAKRPLRREELYFAILAGEEPEAVTTWNPEEITHAVMERFILNSSKGLAEVRRSKDHTVQFIHESVRDFFLKENGLDTLQFEIDSRLPADLGSNFPGLSQERLKQCCQAYIDASQLLPSATPMPVASSEEAADLRQRASEKFPFLEYAVRNVLHHADAAKGYGVSQDAFVESFPLETWITLNNFFERYQIRRYTPDASLLYILAQEDLPNLVRIELRRVPHMDIKGERYGFPMLAALANDNIKAISALLILDTDALSDGAVSNGQPLRPTNSDRREAFESLLKNRREISSQKTRSLLFWAAEQGNIVLTNLLLKTGKINMNLMDKDGLTPLSLAARDGHEGVVKLLLETGNVDVDVKSKKGHTPLSLAAENVHEGVVKLLLETRKVDVDSKDKNGETLLRWALRRQHEEIVKLLLETGKVDVDSKDEAGETPLSLAARYGQEGAVKLLLETGKVDVDVKSKKGHTPLSLAAKNGHDGVVKLLLETRKVDVDVKSNYGQTPLSPAAETGHEGAVKLLLETGRVDVDSKDGDRCTPLSLAAENEHEGVVKLLLETGKVDVDSMNMYGRTPLSLAAKNGHDGVVKLLLETGKVDVDSNGWFWRTPLSLAAKNGHNGVVKLLLETGKVDVDSMNMYGETPLSLAAENEHEGVVKLLLETGKVDVDSTDKNGETLLRWALRRQHEEIVKLLLETGKVDVDSKDEAGETPLSLAARYGQEGAVKLLLETGKVDVDSKSIPTHHCRWQQRMGTREY